MVYAPLNTGRAVRWITCPAIIMKTASDTTAVTNDARKILKYKERMSYPAENT